MIKILSILTLSVLLGCGNLELKESNADVVLICRAVVTESPAGDIFKLEPVATTKGALSPDVVDPKTGLLLWSRTLPENHKALGYYEVYLKKGFREPPATVTSINQVYLMSMKSVEYTESEP